MFSLPGAASCSHTCTPLWSKEKKTPSLWVWFCTHRRRTDAQGFQPAPSSGRECEPEKGQLLLNCFKKPKQRIRRPGLCLAAGLSAFPGRGWTRSVAAESGAGRVGLAGAWLRHWRIHEMEDSGKVPCSHNCRPRKIGTHKERDSSFDKVAKKLVSGVLFLLGPGDWEGEG